MLRIIITPVPLRVPRISLSFFNLKHAGLPQACGKFIWGWKICKRVARKPFGWSGSPAGLAGIGGEGIRERGCRDA